MTGIYNSFSKETPRFHPQRHLTWCASWPGTVALKTMMAAFIIAIKGTIKQAVMLGLAATISHTAVVWLIAFGGWHQQRYRSISRTVAPLISSDHIGTAPGCSGVLRGERNWLENMHEYDLNIITTITKITTTMDIITITNMASIRMPMHEPMPMTLNDALMVERSPTGKFCYLALTGGCLIPSPGSTTCC